MEKAIEKETCDGIIHLGDGYTDAEEVEHFYPGKAFIKMPGNCDYRYDVPFAKSIFTDGVRVFMTHGDKFGVKDGLYMLRMKARDKNATVALYGHTHEANCEDRDGILLLNPGTIRHGEYAILELKNGKATAVLKEI